MNHFEYRNGALCAEDVPLADIAAAVGTPFYCYSTATLERHYRVFTAAFADVPASVCYSLKANANLAVVRTLAALGAGADVVSGGELKCALAAGVPAARIIFSGVGKTRDEMALALGAGILQFNVESFAELELLSEVAESFGARAPVALRINPDVDARTHAKITTGVRGNKFGIDHDRARDAAARAAGLAGVDLVGLAVHIGSQLTELAPFEAAFTRVAELARTLRADGHTIDRLDLGGGLGIRYHDETAALPDAYAEMVKRTTAGLGCQLYFEPGRVIVGNAGVLVAQVLYVKDSGARRFVVVDAAMNDLPRPTLYDAYHEIEPVAAPAPGAVKAPVDVVGPVCESGDTFARDRALPPLSPGDLLVFRTAGAYGAVMASTYNARPLAPEVLVRGAEFALVRRRPDFDEMTALEEMPDWLGDAPGAAGGRARGVA
ncbi:MAG: diaminopimelate decarboxylase [Alphaproteobacteria bacterium]